MHLIFILLAVKLSRYLTHCKAEFIVKYRVQTVFDNLGLQFLVGSRHQEHPDKGVTLPKQISVRKITTGYNRCMELLVGSIIMNLIQMENYF